MKFIVRSLLILLALYGLVFVIGDVYLAHTHASLWVAIVFVLCLVGFQYLIGPWLIEVFLDINWKPLPPANREFVEKLCVERGIPHPRIGIIQSGTPNAFSFGHVPADSRVVVTTGLLDALTPEEANAVLAHELGHIEHWDFVVMTIAGLVPLLLYQIYAFSRHVNKLRALAVSAYLCYWVSQFVVLMLNRTREYFADHYSAEVTRSPDALSSALVKIAYGMIKADGEYQQAMRYDSKAEKSHYRREQRMAGGLAIMGISNLRSGTALALSGADPADAAAVMRWDLVSPWARIYELSSTHPLTALRVRELNRDTQAMGQVARYPLPEYHHRGWTRFSLEFLLWVVPWMGAAALAAAQWIPDIYHFPRIHLPANSAPALLIFTGFAWMLRIWYRYHGEFQPTDVGALIKDLEVSEMYPRAVRVTGHILGRGVPGAFWSPDLVLQDSTGMVFVLYRQTIPLMRFLFAITAAEQCIGQEVVIDGWFRRGLRPYIEMCRLTTEWGDIHRAYSRWVQFALAASAVAAGFMWLYS